MGHRKTYKVRVKLDSPLSDQTGEGYPLTRFISLRGLFLTSLMAIHRKIALLPLRNMAPRGVHPGWIRGAPGCTPCISILYPLWSPSISPLSPLYGGDWWGVVGTGGEAPPPGCRPAATAATAATPDFAPFDTLILVTFVELCHKNTKNNLPNRPPKCCPWQTV